MKCPFCGHTEDRVVDSRVGREGEFIRRRRECLECHRRYTTYEYIEDVLPHVVKRDGRREPFDRQKLRGSILKACEKRSVGVQAVDDVVADIEARLHERAEKEISSLELGDLVMEHLQKLDQVAYVRFASVYRKFQDVTDFADELRELSSGRGDRAAGRGPAPASSQPSASGETDAAAPTAPEPRDRAGAAVPPPPRDRPDAPSASEPRRGPEPTGRP
jgi:transcriptional repressor NrdR